MAFMTGFGAGRMMPGYNQGALVPQTAPTPTPIGGAQGTQPQPMGGFQPTATQKPQQQQQAGYGMQNPYHVDNYPVAAPPPAPTSQMTNDFIPPLISGPYVNAINGAQNQANWFGQATPQAAAFQQAMFSPGMTQMEQMFAGSAAEMGGRQLGQTHNRLAGMFENSTGHGNLAPAFFDATNQFNAQLNNMIGQMGTQRQGQAANLLPFTAGFPIQAWQAGMQGSQGLYDMLQNSMYGDLSYPLAVLGSNPVMLPTTVVS